MSDAKPCPTCGEPVWDGWVHVGCEDTMSDKSLEAAQGYSVNDGTTHWDGCEREHLPCALARLARVRNALADAEGRIAELEAAEKDAERYRWLNKQHNFMVYIDSEPETRRNVRLRCGEALNGWIDARRGGEGEK